jgi:hypothetical protein
MRTGGSFPGSKRPGRGAEHLVLMSKMVELYLHSPICLHGIVLKLYLLLNASLLRLPSKATTEHAQMISLFLVLS